MRRIAFLLTLSCLATTTWAGAWTQPKGRVWVKVSGIVQESNEFYSELSGIQLADGTVVNRGDRRPYDDGGVSRQRLIWSELEVGVTDDLTLGFQLPYYRFEFEDDVAIIESFGIGDIRFTGRYGILTGANRVTGRVAWKLPTGPADPAPDRIRIGEGQHDVELGLQAGRGLGHHLTWVGVEAGYRLRARDTARDFRPGNEWFWFLEAGVGLVGPGTPVFEPNLPIIDRIGLKAAYTGARGGEPYVDPFSPVVDLSRDFDQFDLVLMFDAAWVFLELGWAQTLGSETYPADAIWSLGASRTHTLW